MKIVFCTTCRNRAFHLERTLPKNMADNPRSTFVVMDYGSEDNLQEVLRPLKSERLLVYKHEASAFHMTHAKNMAHRLGILAGADVLVNVDADNYLHEGFEDYIEANFRPDNFLWAGNVKGLGKKFRGVSGRIGLTPEAFLKTGGYDERFTTWARDDKDLTERLCLLKYHGLEAERRNLECIPHGDGLRFREYPEAKEAVGAYECKHYPKSAVVNGGRIGCGKVTCDNGTTISLTPIPTRIFGIGMHKTATTSLHVALKTLGYESEHWGSGGWARQVYNEMLSAGVSPALERFYAASDLPITLLYEELDRAYPGSKFILTVRDEVDWLRSVRAHFSRQNPFRWEWDVYPFNHRIHQAVYGRRDFDALTFLARYRRHNAEVMDYFKGRPNDLLVMKEMRWDGLCGFLGRDVPAVEYPRKFVTKGRVLGHAEGI